ncbi:MAG: EH signature domain-containing protein [Crinalium sp.]
MVPKNAIARESTMNFRFRQLHLNPSQPPSYQPTELIKLSEGIEKKGRSQFPANIPRLSISKPRSLAEIISDIQSNKIEKVSVLEWVYCLYHKKTWDAQNPDLRIASSQAIWQAANKNSWLLQKLSWRVALYYSGQKETAIADSLVDTFPSNIESNSLTIQIINIIKQPHAAKALAKRCYTNLLLPQQLLQEAQLPTWIPVATEALNHFDELFFAQSNINYTETEWLLRCLNQMSVEQQLSAVEYLLNKISPELGGKLKQLVTWLEENYSPRVTNSRWNQLSLFAKSALRKWIGAVNYQDFDNLVGRLLETFDSESPDSKQLKSRRKFWADYRTRFQRLRILFPQNSVKILDSYLNRQDVSILIDDGSEPSEVCIFDFGDWFVIEIFRGRGSETRLIPKNPETESILFGYNLSIKRLRCLGGERHDHKYLWQISCREWLNQNQIYPSREIQDSRNPTDEQQQDRNRQLIEWNRVIRQLEQEAQEYCRKIKPNPADDK